MAYLANYKQALNDLIDNESHLFMVKAIMFFINWSRHRSLTLSLTSLNGFNRPGRVQVPLQVPRIFEHLKTFLFRCIRFAEIQLRYALPEGYRLMVKRVVVTSREKRVILSVVPVTFQFRPPKSNYNGKLHHKLWLVLYLRPSRRPDTQKTTSLVSGYFVWVRGLFLRSFCANLSSVLWQMLSRQPNIHRIGRQVARNSAEFFCLMTKHKFQFGESAVVSPPKRCPLIFHRFLTKESI